MNKKKFVTRLEYINQSRKELQKKCLEAIEEHRKNVDFACTTDTLKSDNPFDKNEATKEDARYNRLFSVTVTTEGEQERVFKRSYEKVVEAVIKFPTQF